MKKIIFILLLIFLQTQLFSKTHLNLPLKYLAVKGKYEQSCLANIINIEKSELLFNNNGENYTVSIYNGNYTVLLDTFEPDREILSVFFDEISGDGVKEIFMITKLNNQYEIYSYGVDYFESASKFTRLKDLDKKLNNIFKNKKNLNASMVRKEIRGKIPLDYNSLEFWKTYYENPFYKGTNFLKGKFMGYFDKDNKKIKDIEKAVYYIKKYDKNIYGKFNKEESFVLSEVFQVKQIKEEPYYIRNGKHIYRFSPFYIEEGNYKNGLKEGEWFYQDRGYHSYGKYKDNKEVGEWCINGYVGKMVNGVRDGVWIHENGLSEEIYKNGNFVEEREIKP